MGIPQATCDFCVGMIGDYSGFARCQHGHFLCETCVRAARTAWPKKNVCPKCGWVLISQEEYINQPSFESQVMRAAGKMQVRWWKYLFFSPDLVLVMLSWGFSLLFLISAGRSASFFSNILEWIVGSVFVAVAPVLTLMFIRKKKSGQGMVAGWMTAWRGDRRPVWVIVGVASVVFLIHLMLEHKPIG